MPLLNFILNKMDKKVYYEVFHLRSCVCVCLCVSHSVSEYRFTHLATACQIHKHNQCRKTQRSNSGQCAMEKVDRMRESVREQREGERQSHTCDDEGGGRVIETVSSTSLVKASYRNTDFVFETV